RREKGARSPCLSRARRENPSTCGGRRRGGNGGSRTRACGSEEIDQQQEEHGKNGDAESSEPEGERPPAVGGGERGHESQSRAGQRSVERDRHPEGQPQGDAHVVATQSFRVRPPEAEEEGEGEKAGHDEEGGRETTGEPQGRSCICSVHHCQGRTAPRTVLPWAMPASRHRIVAALFSCGGTRKWPRTRVPGSHEDACCSRRRWPP